MPRTTPPDEAANAQADALIQESEKVGREAAATFNLEKGKRAMALLKQATGVAPGYRRAWEQYRYGLTELKKRFGHGMVMKDAEIDRDVALCDDALKGLA